MINFTKFYFLVLALINFLYQKREYLKLKKKFLHFIYVEFKNIS